jgi:hypothetical protein
MTVKMGEEGKSAKGEWVSTVTRETVGIVRRWSKILRPRYPDTPAIAIFWKVMFVEVQRR